MTDDVVKVPAADHDVCNTTKADEHADEERKEAAPAADAAKEQRDEEVCKKKIIFNPHAPPAFRLLAEATACLKGKNNQNPENIHRPGV